MSARGSSRGDGARRGGRGVDRGFGGARGEGPRQRADGGRGASRPRPAGPRRPVASRPASAPASRARSRPAGSVERILARQPWEALAPHLERAGGEPAAITERLQRFARELLEWNRGASNLISGADEARIVERHLIESVEPARWLSESGLSRWLDLGSGGGLPAIPLAMLGVGERWTLVESRRTKSLFLRKAIQELGLKNVSVVNERIENLFESVDLTGQFDGFTSRATMKLGPTLAAAVHFVRIGGHAYLWKGSGREREMQDDPTWRGTWRLDGLLTLGSGPTVVCRFIREK